VVYKIPTKLLIERGVLSKATIRMVRCEQSSDKASWASVYKQLVVASKRRNDLVAELAEGARKPALLFVDQLAHGHQLVKLLRARGIRADVAFGDNQLSERQRKVRALENGEIDVLVCNVIFQEGIDIPALKSVVVAAGKSAATATIQRLGRGMRTCADGDDTFELWDVFDTGQKWLAQHSRDRRAAYESEEHEVWTGELHEVARP
jgi:superfamily II DNA or RNA helicase